MTSEYELTATHYDEPPKPEGGIEAIQKNLIYPRNAKMQKVQGQIIVWAKIDEQGRIRRTRIGSDPLGSGCEGAAMKAVTSVKWKPAILGDKPVEAWIGVPVEFKLNDNPSLNKQLPSANINVLVQGTQIFVDSTNVQVSLKELPDILRKKKNEVKNPIFGIINAGDANIELVEEVGQIIKEIQ